MNPETLITLFTLAHIFGAIIGAGSAYVGDTMYLYSMRDHKLTPTEVGFMTLTGHMVWGGLFLLAVSGLGIFLMNPEVYTASDKFILKMGIVFLLTINGVIFHLLHLPVLRKMSDSHKTIYHSRLFARKSPLIYASGALSVVSWTFAVTLGSLRSIPVSLAGGISIYILVVGVAMIVSEVMRRRMLGGGR